jgi:hypothetical protein
MHFPEGINAEWVLVEPYIKKNSITIFDDLKLKGVHKLKNMVINIIIRILMMVINNLFVCKIFLFIYKIFHNIIICYIISGITILKHNTFRIFFGKFLYI